MKKLCLFCSTPVVGRVDKKFCDDQCRSNHYQHSKTTDPDLLKVINRVLKKNRSVLSKLNPNGQTKVSRSKLMSSGFDLNYYTHSYKTRKGNLYFFCYDYGYLQLIKDKFLLVKKEPKL